MQDQGQALGFFTLEGTYGVKFIHRQKTGCRNALRIAGDSGITSRSFKSLRLSGSLTKGTRSKRKLRPVFRSQTLLDTCGPGVTSKTPRRRQMPGERPPSRLRPERASSHVVPGDPGCQHTCRLPNRSSPLRHERCQQHPSQRSQRSCHRHPSSVRGRRRRHRKARGTPSGSQDPTPTARGRSRHRHQHRAHRRCPSG